MDKNYEVIIDFNSCTLGAEEAMIDILCRAGYEVCDLEDDDPRIEEGTHVIRCYGWSDKEKTVEYNTLTRFLEYWF